MSRPAKQTILPGRQMTILASSTNGTGQYPLCDLGTGVTAQIRDITPDTCKEWLAEPGDVQRRMRNGQINMISSDITEDRWVFNGQPFIFDDSKPVAKMLDGRHRCHAIIQANVAVRAIVLCGLPSKAFYTMDQIAVRTREDALGAMGYDDARTLGTAAQILWHYIEGNLVNGNVKHKLSPVASIEVVQQHPDLVKALHRGKTASRLFHGTGVPVFCYYVLSRIDEEAAGMFFHRLVTGEELQAGNPILALRNRLLNDRFGYRDAIYLVFKAWNRFRADGNCMSLAIKPNEPFPSPI